MDPIEMMNGQLEAVCGNCPSYQMLLKEEEKTTQKKENNKTISPAANSGTKTILPKEIKFKMENSFGTSFANVSIHTNDEGAKDMAALTYTQGKDVHFAPGQYNPGPQKGQE